MKSKIRHFHDSDAKEISNIICRNLLEINSKDYTADTIKNFIKEFTPEKIIQLSCNRDIFVAEIDGKIVGTASLAIDNRTNDNKKYVCLTVFILPENHRMGIGKMLMDHIESIARKKHAVTLEVPAGFTALQFYSKLGYRAQTTQNENYVWMFKDLTNQTENSNR